jgi:hypothetical protein
MKCQFCNHTAHVGPCTEIIGQGSCGPEYCTCFVKDFDLPEPEPEPEKFTNHDLEGK